MSDGRRKWENNSFHTEKKAFLAFFFSFRINFTFTF